MEPSTIIPILSAITPKIINSALEKQDEVIQVERLKRLFLLECQCNLKLLDVTQWKDISDEFIREITKHLRTDAAQAIHCFIEKRDAISWFGKMGKKFISQEPKEERDEAISKLMSLISRIETLKVLSNLDDKFQEENKARYNTRLRNLRKLIIEMMSEESG